MDELSVEPLDLWTNLNSADVLLEPSSFEEAQTLDSIQALSGDPFLHFPSLQPLLVSNLLVFHIGSAATKLCNPNIDLCPWFSTHRAG